MFFFSQRKLNPRRMLIFGNGNDAFKVLEDGGGGGGGGTGTGSGSGNGGNNPPDPPVRNPDPPIRIPDDGV